MFNKGLKRDEKSEGILKRQKNIEDKTNNNNLRAIEGQKGDGIKSTGYNFKESLLPEALTVFNQIVEKKK